MSTPTKNTVTQERIDSLLDGSTFEHVKMGEKSTVVLCVLPNGFQIIESSSCVDPANYDHDLGVQIAKKRIAEKVWMLEGYLMQQHVWAGSAVATDGEAATGFDPNPALP